VTCSILNCERPVYRREWCQRHYRRWQRHGDPEHPVIERVSKHPETCTVEECSKPYKARGLCHSHYAALLAHGDPLVNHRPDYGRSESYKVAHDRVKVERGSASEHDCYRCSKPAKDWAYDHPDERYGSVEGRRLAYSLDIDHYVPLCARCHVRFDRGDLFGTSIHVAETVDR
jgi:hypothetical protein